MPTRNLPGDEHRQLERVEQAELREILRSGQRHEDVVAFQRSLECCVGVTGRARDSSFLGPV